MKVVSFYILLVHDIFSPKMSVKIKTTLPSLFILYPKPKR